MMNEGIAARTHAAKHGWLGDLFIILMMGCLITGIAVTAGRWTAAYQPDTVIHLQLIYLPFYAMASLFRALIAYVLSLTFTIVVGYAAARGRTAERFLLPLLDIGQSIPVLGFLPGLVLGLIAIFPHSSLGLELACIIMIFTGQCWNMAFSYYASLKSVPTSYLELSENIGLSSWRTLWTIETPFAANGLAWNSLMSMAGGWFFLTVCEAFTLKGQKFQLPGLGAYMSAAIEEGQTLAIVGGLLTMIMVILSLDFVVWRPLISWTRRFRLDEPQEGIQVIPFAEVLFQESRIVNWLRAHLVQSTRIEPLRLSFAKSWLEKLIQFLRKLLQNIGPNTKKSLWILAALPLLLVFGLGLYRLSLLLMGISWQQWITIFQAAGASLLRVVGAMLVGSLWAVPIGIWVGISTERTRRWQPFIQVGASFPAPMIYPLALAILHRLHIGLGVGAGVLMLLGVQWYILFNVLAGATTISPELRDSFRLIGLSKKSTWIRLYFPAIFPALITGWVTAAGGAWNASIVAEYILYQGETLSTLGLGALINEATAVGDFRLLAATMFCMVIIVVGCNRLVWHRLYAFAEARFRTEK